MKPAERRQARHVEASWGRCRTRTRGPARPAPRTAPSSARTRRTAPGATCRRCRATAVRPGQHEHAVIRVAGGREADAAGQHRSRRAGGLPDRVRAPRHPGPAGMGWRTSGHTTTTGWSGAGPQRLRHARAGQRPGSARTPPPRSLRSHFSPCGTLPCTSTTLDARRRLQSAGPGGATPKPTQPSIATPRHDRNAPAQRRAGGKQDRGQRHAGHADPGGGLDQHVPDRPRDGPNAAPGIPRESRCR